VPLGFGKVFRSCFCCSKTESQPKGWKPEAIVFQEQLILGSSILKAPHTLLLYFWPSVFEMVKIKNSFTVVSKKNRYDVSLILI
jgi:hypothetical protein